MNHLFRYLPGIAGVSLVLMLLLGNAGGETEKPPAAIDPEAEKLLHKVADFYGGLKSFRVEMSTSMRYQAQGAKKEMTSDHVIAMQRPNRFAMISEGRMMSGTTVCNGSNLFLYLPMLKKYIVQRAPENLDRLTEDKDYEMTALQLRSGLLMHCLIRAKPYDCLAGDLTELKYAGTDTISGVQYHRVKASQPRLDWEMWIEAGDKPLIRRIVPDMKKRFSATREQTPGKQDTNVEVEITFQNWAVNIELPADQFQFTPPDGVRKTDSLFGEAGGGGGGEEEAHPLLGKPAPSFTLDLLDGDKLDLAAHKGKQIVILDFWATWCGPCVRALPVLSEVAAAYKEKGVVFYAVNQREDAERIRAFLKKRELKLTVALDREGRVGEQYGVEGIPQTVVIGKDGTVQVVHVGFLPGLKQQLAEELDALLAGKSLATKTPP